MQMKEGLYLVFFSSPLFQKITPLKATRFLYVSGQFHTFIPVSISFHHLTPIMSPHLVIASHSHSNIHIILL